MTEPKVTYGLLISTAFEYGIHKVTAEIMCREESGERAGKVLGISSNDQDRFWRDNEPKNLAGLQMEGLGIYGFVSADYSSTPEAVNFIGYGYNYLGVYSIDVDDAARMLKTLRKLHARASADNAREPGDMFASLANALKLSWVCERLNPKGWTHEWRFMSVGEGRNRYRQMIAKATADAIATKFPQATPAAAA